LLRVFETAILLGVLCVPLRAQQPETAAPKPAPETGKRVELNLLGQVDTQSGESRRNENVQFNLIDNNALKELNVRLGTTATIVEEFDPGRNYFGAEFGNAPSPVLHVAPAQRAGFHGHLRYSHQNSVSTARSFFQVGAVQPARENDYGFSLIAPLTPVRRTTWLQLDGSQQRIRGQVNGNVLVPRADERTPLTTNPATRAIAARFLDAYPLEPPNRTDINERALNTNSPQSIDNDSGGARLDNAAGQRDRFAFQYQFMLQQVTAFQLVAGQNPDTDTRNHRARTTWTRIWSAATITDFSAGFDRIGSLLRPEPNAVGPMVSTGGLTTLGPNAIIPIDRAQNLFRYAGQVRQTRGRHNWTAGFTLLRRQLNGLETDAHRGFFSFGNDFGRDAITNLRLGTPSQHIVSIGDVHRGFRNWDMQYHVGDHWRVKPNLQLQLGLRYQPVTRPFEVNRREVIPYDCDCNNFAPQFGLAWNAPGRLGVVRAAYGLHYGEIFPVTFQQVRFSPPNSVKIVVPAPDLVNPLGGITPGGLPPDVKGNLYLLDPELATPYSHQYNFSWEPEFSGDWRVQFGYVGSRSHKLLLMWYTNRAHPVPGIPQTTATLNQRRPDRDWADIRWVLNGSRGYYDAARATLIVPRWRGLTLDASYWFSKAMDLGSSYTNTAYDSDSRQARGQWEFDQHADMRALSLFHQQHALLLRGSYALPSGRSFGGRAFGGWEISGVGLFKPGTPFAVVAGSDAPGYGNVDGNGGDRPNLADPSVLGRTIGHPDTSRRLLPRDAFRPMAPTDARGNLGNNTFRKGPIRNVNAALSRTWTVNAHKRVTFRAESINAFNTPQFAEPGFEWANPNFGAITNTLNDGRTVRFGLQFGW
jgi:hypothetical protein